MPTYQYECTNCGAITEVFQSIKDSARRKLRKSDDPTCNCDAPVTRLIGTGAGIIFKGSGFYQTDYRSEEYKKAAKAEKEAAKDKPKKDTDGKSTKPTDSKPAKPSAAKSPVAAEK